MANRELSFNLGAGVSSSSAVEDPEVAAELLKLYNALNTIAFKLDEYTGAINAAPADRPYISASVACRAAYINRIYKYTAGALTARTLVNIDSSGNIVAADIDVNRAHAIVMEDTAADSYAPITLGGIVGGFVGLTPGAYYYLSTTAGAIQLGVTAQKVGFAVSSTELAFGFLP
jgi:hypothetical protein